MWDFKIENVANTVLDLCSLFDCSIEVAWEDYMHDLIKEQFTLEEVLNYLEDMEILKQLDERMKNDNGVRYTLEDLKLRIKERKLKNIDN